MTTAENATVEPAQTAQEPPAVPAEGDATPDQDGPGREAARYRRALRETESERDGLRGRVTALQRSEVQRIASEVLQVPASIWTSGVQLDALLSEDGSVDPTLVSAAATSALTSVGLAPRMRNPAPDHGQGQRTMPAPQQEPSWKDFLTGEG